MNSFIYPAEEQWILSERLSASEYGQTSANWRLLASGCGHAGSAECITKKCPSAEL